MGHLPFERRETRTLEKSPSDTDPKYGKSPESRSVEEKLERGIVVINKPSGPTSHQVSAYVQNILKIKKSGHSGTLDPQVTGVLPVALGKGTRIVQSLLTAGKEYVCLMHIHKDVPEDKIKKVCDTFVGKIKQLPPIKSAVARRWRYRKIYYLEILEIQGQEVLFRVGCQAGTYIRKLCHDIGEKLGTGAHMAELIRTKAAGFSENQMVSLQDLTDAFHYHKKGDSSKLHAILMPIETGVEHLSKIWVHDSAVEPLCNGMQLKLPGISKLDSDIQAEDTVAVMTLKNELILTGTVRMASKDLMGDRGIAVKTDQVFMPSGIYPKK